MIFKLFCQKPISSSEKRYCKLRCKYFYDTYELSHWFARNNRKDEHTISKEELEKLRKDHSIVVHNNFGIEKFETPLFVRDTSLWDSGNQGVVITDYAIHCVPNNGNLRSAYKIKWKDIRLVQYDGTQKGFLFKGQGDKLLGPKLNNHDFFYSVADDSDVCNKLAFHLTNMAQIEIRDMLDVKNIQQKEKVATMLKSSGENVPLIHKTLGECYYNKQDYQRALIEFNTAISLETVDSAFRISCLEMMASANRISNKKFEARRNYITLLGEPQLQSKTNILNLLDSLEEELKADGIWDNFTSQPLAARKFIIPIEDEQIGGCDANHITTLRMSNIPSDISFSTGFPIPQIIYMAHPIINSRYLPMETSSDEIFIEQVNEYVQILQCLGAEEIKIDYIKGMTEEECMAKYNTSHFGGTIKMFSGSLDFEESNEAHKTEERSLKMSRTYRFNPSKQPYLPKELIWYSHKKEWQNLVLQRKEGNLLEYTDEFSTNEIACISKSEQARINAEASFLKITANSGKTNKNNSDSKIQHETKWMISTKFRDLSLLE